MLNTITYIIAADPGAGIGLINQLFSLAVKMSNSVGVVVIWAK